jgi:Cu/Ag efflux protein CusF
MRLPLVIATLTALAACGRSPGPPDPALRTNNGKMEVIVPGTPAEQTYTVRAVVMGLPATGRAFLELHHEEIPDFIGRDGAVEGMKEMIMDFPSIHPAADLRPLRVGDKVEVTFEVRWKSEPRTIVTALTPLPADTVLNLKPVTDPG